METLKALDIVIDLVNRSTFVGAGANQVVVVQNVLSSLRDAAYKANQEEIENEKTEG